jgi:predicted peroxiredoxin
MAESLGICVSTRNNFDHVLGLAKAAQKTGKKVEIFFTGDGVLCTQIRMADLIKIAHVTICEVSYFANGYKGIEIPGLGDKDFVTQARNAEMVEECDRYVIL